MRRFADSTVPIGFVVRQAPYVALLLILLLFFGREPISTARSLSDVPPAASLFPDMLQLASEEHGFLAVDGRMYRTAANSEHWEEITPAGGAVIAGRFADPETGWAVLAPDPKAPYSGGTLRLAVTHDGGRSWEALGAPFPVDDSDAPIAQVHLFFATPEDGWLVWRFAGSSNFREGALFRTRDGGRTWTRHLIPFGEPVFFADALRGWVAGGPAADGLYETSDGGESWTRAEAPAPPGSEPGARPIYGLPAMQEGAIILPVTWRADDGTVVAFYGATQDSAHWQLSGVAPAPATREPRPEIEPETLVVHDGALWTLAAGHSPEFRGSGIAFAVAPAEAPQGSERVAWRVEAAGICAAGVCRQETRLLRTEDGGRTWAQLSWPEGFGAAQVFPASPARLHTSDETSLFDGQGFDKCEIATASQLGTWITESPYRAVNLYFGGSSRACSNRALSATFLRILRAQGWVFIPTWVGPQAPCTSYSVRMDADPTVAYQQGLAEADAAIAQAAALELADEDGSGTVVYYDLEYFAASNTACLQATQAFLTGWTERIQAAGSLSGVYSTGCVVNGQSGNVPPPDAIWVANWAYSSYTPSASVWNLYCLSNTLWSNHQRLRQYTGGHNETWGGVTLNIDSDVLDGPVALLRSSPTPTATPTATSTSTATPTHTPTAPAPRQFLWLPLIRR